MRIKSENGPNERTVLLAFILNSASVDPAFIRGPAFNRENTVSQRHRARELASFSSTDNRA